MLLNILLCNMYNNAYAFLGKSELRVMKLIAECMNIQCANVLMCQFANMPMCQYDNVLILINRDN